MRRITCAVTASFMLALAGCGGGDDDKNATSEPSAAAETTTQAAAAPAPELDAVLACMKQAGAEAEDQSSSTGDKIGIDYPAGRLLVSFEESEDDAKLTASVAETQDPDSTVVQKGTVVITAPADPAAAEGQKIAEDCVG